ncbi:OmpH family outer membrane protein [Sulfitobacter sp. HNIBRBA2951]|uniref:OmpH family outer membrane protein n=1 Tax=Sulfitobacter aquimarinus TaxID=3158557 RepID=UPI0032DFC67A
MTASRSSKLPFKRNFDPVLRQRLKWISLVAALLGPAPLLAQELSIGQLPAMAILTIDSERMFLNSAFGIRVASEIEARGNDLATENRQIELELAEAEQELTDKRATMTPAEFRPLADAFDTRVQETRQAQATKSRALNDLLEQEREVFLRAAGPVLQALMAEVGASVVLERRTVFISTNASDITAEAITRINASLGAGTPSADPAQDAQPEPAQD